MVVRECGHDFMNDNQEPQGNPWSKSLMIWAGIIGALAVAWVLKRITAKSQIRTLMMELPSYHLPTVRNVLIGLKQRVVIFMSRVGGIIMIMTIALWFLASYPGAPDGATGAAIEQYAVGRGRATTVGRFDRTPLVVFTLAAADWRPAVQAQLSVPKVA